MSGARGTTARSAGPGKASGPGETGRGRPSDGPLCLAHKPLCVGGCVRAECEAMRGRASAVDVWARKTWRDGKGCRRA